MAALTARVDGEATTVTTIMATAAQPHGTMAPETPPGAGVAQLRGIMVTAAPTAPEEGPLIGAVGPEVPPDTGAARLRGITAPALTKGPTGVRAPGDAGSRAVSVSVSGLRATLSSLSTGTPNVSPQTFRHRS